MLLDTLQHSGQPPKAKNHLVPALKGEQKW